MRTDPWEKWAINYGINSWFWDYILCFGAPGLIAQFSKCDFWNLEKIWDRNMKPDYVRPGSGGGLPCRRRTCTELTDLLRLI